VSTAVLMKCQSSVDSEYQSRVSIDTLDTVDASSTHDPGGSAIHCMNHYPEDSVVCFVNSYPLDSDLSIG